MVMLYDIVLDTIMQKLLKEGELMKFSRKEKQPRMFFLVSRNVQKNAKKVVIKKVNVKKKKKKKMSTLPGFEPGIP